MSLFSRVILSRCRVKVQMRSSQIHLGKCSLLAYISRVFRAEQRESYPGISHECWSRLKPKRWQSVWENKVELNISESGVHPLTTAELVPDAETLRKILDVPQGYPQTNGSEELRSRIAELYPGAQIPNVLVTCGGSEANFISTWMLLEPGDEVVFMLPNYMQISGLATAFGALVKPLWLREKLNWGIDIGELAHLITAKTKLIAICNPNNPTGAVLRREERVAIVKAAAVVGAWILSDEVYRGAEMDSTKLGGEKSDDEMTPTFWGGYERVLCTGGLSKAYSLPGLRTGWVVGPTETIERLWSYHDYTSIGPTMLTDRLASAALGANRRGWILNRARLEKSCDRIIQSSEE